MIRFKHLLSLFLLTGIFFISFQFLSAANPTKGDTINVPKIQSIPVIDGAGTDICWDSAAWNPMPYVWIPYNATMSAADFTGRFKVVWSEQENMLYFLFEITDDKFVNGYVFSSSNGDYWKYDVVEIFIDENRSGGLHETTNNAFAYHITGGNQSTDYDAVDMWGSTRVNYKDHFPEFQRVQTGNVYVWEFSHIVMKDTYTPGSAADHSSTLQTGKKLGFSAAYCDNDNSSVNPQRDNFIASKFQTQANSNESYKNASIFGLMQLVNEPTTNPVGALNPGISNTSHLSIFPNPVYDLAELSFSSPYSGPVEIRIFNPTGQVLRKTTYKKSQSQFQQKIDFSEMIPGMYVIRLDAGNDHKIMKVIKSDSR